MSLGGYDAGGENVNFASTPWQYPRHPEISNPK
jgi:hypothetical protein